MEPIVLPEANKVIHLHCCVAPVMREMLIGVHTHAGAINMDDIRKWLGDNKLRSVGEVSLSTKTPHHSKRAH